MRRTTMVMLAALLGLTGCFEPVLPLQPGDEVDAGPEPHCAVYSDCPHVGANHCAPLESVCRSGVCTTEALPVVWDDRPGACEVDEDCDCQALGRGECDGDFECRAGSCTWTCDAPACSVDRDCPIGQVCEPGPDCSTEKRCVAGCHENSDCSAGLVCQRLDCTTCPCPGQCVQGPACRTDADCPAQTVCEKTPDKPPHCIPGCRDDRGCEAGEACVYGACPECEDCPCVGQCQAVEECVTNADCPRGSTCAQDFDCRQKCIPGACKTETDCAPGDTCTPPPPCASCGCDHGSCVPGPQPCQVNSDCAQGLVCGFGDGCERTCVPGCRSDAECGPGFSCGTDDCDACWCDNPRCKPVEQGCTSDAQCGAGMVCEPVSPDCSGPRQCVRGCHDDSQCGRPLTCVRPLCDSCPCPGYCDHVPGSCTDDASCPAGMVCEQSEGCVEPRTCVPGCHEDSQCPAGTRCIAPPCFTCPCPGYCEPVASCVDADNDGYVVECQYGGCPNARGYCDCNDRDPRVFPGAREVCGNALDENCDGQVDESCGCANGSSCTETLGCNVGATWCSNGCCTSCPVSMPPACAPGECSHATGIDLQGCRMADACGACCTCPAVTDPVCGTNYATFANPCEARCAGVEVLHRGPCELGEGLGCGWPGAPQPVCPRGTYCRDTCPMCDGLLTRCTKIGSCEWDWDCPAGLSPPPCSAGPVRWSCADHTCVFSCP